MTPTSAGDEPGFETLARGLYLEALLTDGEDVWFGDVVTGGIQRLGTDTVLLPERRLVGGLLRNEDGSLLVSGQGGIVWAHPESGASGVLLEGLDGVNEMRADGRGGLYFGTIDVAGIDSGEGSKSSALYHLAVDRTLTLLGEDLAFSNGLSPSADGKLLFHNESFVGTFAYPVEPDGQLGPRKRLAKKPDCDGLALDADGNLWLSGFDSDFLLCLAPDGTELQRLPLPGPCTNVRFGGSDGRDLYLTIVSRESVSELKDGQMPSQETSRLLKGRSPVVGAPLARTRFQLQGEA